MHVIRANSVDHAYSQGMAYLEQCGEVSNSRAGKVLVAPNPVTTVYEFPMKRVLFNTARDANPFFTLFESLWMLAGRNDVAWLDQFIGDFSKRFGEVDGTEHDAYGYRWRKGLGFDQLNAVVERLRADNNDRQGVIQMWDASVDGADDLLGSWLTRPCNTHIYLRVRPHCDVIGPVRDYDDNQIDIYNVGAPRANVAPPCPVLDITVCCRSNDAIWGAYYANAVQFSVLQEYLAARIGVKVGRYYQISNNFHAYSDVFRKFAGHALEFTEYPMQTTPIVTAPSVFDAELNRFLALDFGQEKGCGSYENQFFPYVAWPLSVANKFRREKLIREAMAWLTAFPASDWTVVAGKYLSRRQ